jgi:hypothetical protein
MVRTHKPLPRQELWIVTTEIVLRPGDLPSGETKAFVNVVTWADSSKMAEVKVSRCLESYGWHIISIEDSRPIDEGRVYEEDIADIIDQARVNPKAIIYGTMHTYKGE